MRGDSEADLARRAADSANAKSHERGRMSGGTLTPRAAAWTEYDARSRTVFVLDQAFDVPRGDSTLVLLIDNIDRVAAERTVTALVIPHQAFADESPAPGVDSRGMLDTLGALLVQWDADIRRHPTIRDFLDERSP